MTKQHPGRGGARKGAGRPHKTDEEKRTRSSITLDPSLREWLTTQRQRPNEPMSQIVERLLKERKDAQP